MKQQLKTVFVPNPKRCQIDDFHVITHQAFRIQGQPLITFTKEEYNQHIQDVIENTLKLASEKVDLIETDGDPDPKSITNTFEETFNKYKL